MLTSLPQFGQQEPGSHADIEQFVATRYGAQFPLMSKARFLYCAVALGKVLLSAVRSCGIWVVRHTTKRAVTSLAATSRPFMACRWR